MLRRRANKITPEVRIWSLDMRFRSQQRTRSIYNSPGQAWSCPYGPIVSIAPSLSCKVFWQVSRTVKSFLSDILPLWLAPGPGWFLVIAWDSWRNVKFLESIVSTVWYLKGGAHVGPSSCQDCYCGDWWIGPCPEPAGVYIWEWRTLRSLHQSC